MKNITEHLSIKNFITINSFEWDISDFNILTGRMTAGKSICMKLVHFIDSIFFYNFFARCIKKAAFDKAEFYKNLSEEFHETFKNENPGDVFALTKIEYLLKLKISKGKPDMEFDLKADWDEKNQKLKWRSAYIEKNIKNWEKSLEKISDEEKRKEQILKCIEKDFQKKFPFSSAYIPATRAIACTTNNKDVSDSFFFNFVKLDKQFALRNANVDKIFCDILHLKEIKINCKHITTEKNISFITNKGHKIYPEQLSSGQQELLYLLLLIHALPNKARPYGNTASVYIEELCTHLFPEEQRTVVEYIVNAFRKLKSNNTNARFFITTHSPYVLNVINNMLLKGTLIKNKKIPSKKLEEIRFPHLDMEEVAAYFINENGNVEKMFKDDKKYMIAEKIKEISDVINKDTVNLLNLSDELKLKGNKRR